MMGGIPPESAALPPYYLEAFTFIADFFSHPLHYDVQLLIITHATPLATTSNTPTTTI